MLVLPKAQERQLVAPAKLYSPGKQETQREASMVSLCLPAAHSSHSVEPASKVHDTPTSYWCHQLPLPQDSNVVHESRVDSVPAQFTS